MPHLIDQDGKVIGHINVPHGDYIAHARRPGYRKWEKGGKVRKSKKAAAHDMLRAFLTGKYKRAIVALHQEWYEPMKLMELVK